VTLWEELAVLLAGTAAGTINTVVGSGTLITFPALLALGYPPVTANVSNNLGLVFGAASGAWGYRRELAGTRRMLVELVPASVVGGAIGAVLLLCLPVHAFATIVPVLIALALVLVVAQPRISTVIAVRRSRTGTAHPDVGLLARIGTFLAGIYGGYFGAAQGVVLVGLLGTLLNETPQRVNGIKNLLAAVVNGVAAVTFLVISPGSVDWRVAALIAAGSIGGGFLGARLGRRLPSLALRGVIVVVGVVAIAHLAGGSS
jgi:uncharacterized membrane protein YfcA